MTRLVLICGEGILLDEEEGGRADTVVVRPRAATGLARLNGRRAVAVLIETGEVPDAGLRARRRDALRMDLARYGARIDEIAGPAHAAPALADIAARALRRFAAAPAQTWVLAETLPALEAAAGLGCRRALLRTRAGRRTQAQGVPDSLLPVAVYADLFAAADAMREEGG